jgi:hypothetical protein
MDLSSIISVLETNQLRSIVNGIKKDVSQLDYTLYNVVAQLYYDGKVVNKSGLFFDVFTDFAKEEANLTTVTTATAVGATSVIVADVSKLSVGQTILLQNANNIEAMQISAINTSTKTLTFTPATTFAYAVGSLVHRSVAQIDTTAKEMRAFTNISTLWSPINAIYYSTREVYPEKMKHADYFLTSKPSQSSTLSSTINGTSASPSTQITLTSPAPFRVGDSIVVMDTNQTTFADKTVIQTLDYATGIATISPGIPRVYSTSTNNVVYRSDYKPYISAVDKSITTETWVAMVIKGIKNLGSGTIEEQYSWDDATGGDAITLRIDVSRAKIFEKNLLTANESDVETDTTGWGSSASSGTNFTGSRITTAFYTGTACFKVANTQTTGTQDIMATIANGARINVTAGTQYTFQCMASMNGAFGSGSACRMVQNIYWYNAGGSLISTTTKTNVIPNNTWNRYWVSGQAPAGATSCYMDIKLTNAGVNYNLYVDSAMLEDDAYAPATWLVGGTQREVKPVCKQYGLILSTGNV